MFIQYFCLHNLLYRARKYGMKIASVDFARDTCILGVLCAILMTMSITGANKGCQLGIALNNERIFDSQAATFLLYFVKSMAWCTTTSFGLVFITSPGMRSYITLHPVLQFLVVFSIWPTPFNIQELHEVRFPYILFRCILIFQIFYTMSCSGS